MNKQGTSLLNTENTNSGQALSTLMPSLQNELANPGYTPAQQTAITGATEGGLGAAFGAAQQQATNTAARTGNAASLPAEQDQLARQRMITSGSLAAQNQTNFANDAQKQQAAAQGGLGQIFGQSQSGANQTLGTLAGNSKTPGFWDTLGDSFAGALGKAAVPGGSVGGLSFG